MDPVSNLFEFAIEKEILKLMAALEYEFPTKDVANVKLITVNVELADGRKIMNGKVF